LAKWFFQESLLSWCGVDPLQRAEKLVAQQELKSVINQIDDLLLHERSCLVLLKDHFTG
jgi:hypothetical protein